jgi:peptide/nickel transport system substrate-binding protein
MTRGNPANRRFGRMATTVTAIVIVLGTTLTSAYARLAGHPASASPAYGGSYSERVEVTLPCLDVQKSSGTYFGDYYLDPLLSIDAKGNYVGDLATSYKVSNGGLRITFQLRKGVTFSNGDRFNAAAVKYTFDRAKDPALKSPITGVDLTSVSATNVLSTYKVELSLSTPSRPILTYLASPFTGILDPKAPPTCDSVVGTGPYKIQSAAPDLSTVTLVANKHHTWASSWVHNKTGVPYVNTVTFKAIPNDATAISELLTGGVDISSIRGTQLNRVKGDKHISRSTVPSQGEYFLEFNTARPPFNSAAARRAFAELIDRNGIAKAAFAGQARPNYSMVAPALPYFDKKANEMAPHLSATAAASYIQAHHLTGPYELLALPRPADQTTAEILQAAAAQAGMKLNIVTKDFGTYIPTAASGNFDVLLLAYEGVADPDVLYLLFHSSQGGGKGLAFTGYTSPTLDNLLTKARETLNAKGAASDYAKVQELLAKQAIALGVVVPTTVLGVRNSIHGLHFNKVYQIAIQDLYVKTK